MNALVAPVPQNRRFFLLWAAVWFALYSWQCAFKATASNGYKFHSEKWAASLLSTLEFNFSMLEALFWNVVLPMVPLLVALVVSRWHGRQIISRSLLVMIAVVQLALFGWELVELWPCMHTDLGCQHTMKTAPAATWLILLWMFLLAPIVSAFALRAGWISRP